MYTTVRSFHQAGALQVAISGVKPISRPIPALRVDKHGCLSLTEVYSYSVHRIIQYSMLLNFCQLCAPYAVKPDSSYSILPVSEL
jgi:hypothetical protein